MNAQQLKNSILQEAIEGRLVPQDPNDEPASVLLDKIRAEKKRLVKEGKLKKKDLEETPIPEDEKPFEIPESWEWCSLGSVISLLSGRDLTPQDYNDSNDGIPYITGASNFEGGSLVINRWTPKPVSISKYGDLLITCKGTIGTMAFNTVGDIHIARQVMAISPYLINRYFIMYFLMRIVYELDKKAKSIIPGISREDILTAYFPLPPLAEQKRIVAKIEELLPKVEEYGKAQESLDKLNEELPERLKKSILQEAIEGRLVPQDPNDEPASVLLDKIRAEKKRLVKEGKLKKKDLEEIPISEDEIPFEIPKSWEWVRIGSLTNIMNGFPFKSVNYTNEGIRVIRITNVQDGKIVDDAPKYYPLSEMDNIKKFLLKEGDLLMSLTGNVGRVGIIGSNLMPAALNQRVACLRLYIQDIQSYLYLYLLSEHFKSRCIASGKGMAQLNISTDWLGSYIIPLPPLAEQKRIVAKIEQLMNEIDKLKL